MKTHFMKEHKVKDTMKSENKEKKDHRYWWRRFADVGLRKDWHVVERMLQVSSVRWWSSKLKNVCRVRLEMESYWNDSSRWDKSCCSCWMSREVVDDTLLLRYTLNRIEKIVLYVLVFLNERESFVVIVMLDWSPRSFHWSSVIMSVS